MLFSMNENSVKILNIYYNIKISIIFSASENFDAKMYNFDGHF